MKVYILKNSLKNVGVTASRAIAIEWMKDGGGLKWFEDYNLADFSPAAYLSKRGASKGGKARQAAMTPVERSAHGSKMIAARWGKSKKSSG